MARCTHDRTPANVGSDGRCKICQADRKKVWIAKNRDRHNATQRRYNQDKAGTRDRNLRSKYGIDHAQYLMILARQGGCCAICGTVDPRSFKDWFHVDHDHATKEVRGLLCGKCNTGLGKFNESPALLAKASAYLRGIK
jgi:hypothetical protein